MNNWLHWGKNTADKTPNCYSARRSKGVAFNLQDNVWNTGLEAAVPSSGGSNILAVVLSCAVASSGRYATSNIVSYRLCSQCLVRVLGLLNETLLIEERGTS